MRTFKQELELAKAEPRLRIHSFHRYFGKLIPAIPRTAVRLYASSSKDVVLDPFCGSGTTLVEAKALGRDCIGFDINPLAVLVSRVKTSFHDDEMLNFQLGKLMYEALRDNGKDAMAEAPFCVNRDHWYRDEVIRDLVVMKRNIEKAVDEPYREFFRACLSATNRDVSNSDPKHVFPGYSKRLRKMDANGKRVVDVFQTFEQKAKSRIRAAYEYAHYCPNSSDVRVEESDARSLPTDFEQVALVVMNPPYISSIRYLESMKLEMYWLGMLESTEHQSEMDKRGVGTERYGIQEYRYYHRTGLPNVDELTDRLFSQGEKKMALTVARYFEDMERVFAEMARVIRPKGHLVIKISNSNVRKISVPTADLFAGSLTARHGFNLLEQFDDPFVQSRSLLTKRNTYSGRMDSDFMLVLQKT
ncbi:MAG TPA: DNA methyltransferase [bacterium]|nr:DNA methyltransferase [bacterium]